MKSTQQGWVKLHRQILEWEWFDDPNTFRLFIYCLLKANYTEKKYRGVLVERGTFLTSLEHLSKDTKISVQSVRTCLSRLESTDELTSKRSKQGTVIQVVNYDKYQVLTDESTDNQQDSNKIVTTTKKDKEEKEQKEELFNTFWNKYPNKVGKQPTLTKWLKLPLTDIHNIINNLDLYVKHKPFKEYTHPNPQTFLNQRRWEDEEYKQKPVTELRPLFKDEAFAALRVPAQMDILKSKGYSLEQIKQAANVN